MKYDFDYLKNLYNSDPAEFEKLTRGMINDVINSFSEDNREIYIKKQWRLEQEMNRIKSPLERMNRMVGLFWNGVNEFVEATSGFGSIVAKQPDTNKPHPCNILPFNKKSNPNA